MKFAIHTQILLKYFQKVKKDFKVPYKPWNDNTTDLTLKTTEYGKIWNSLSSGPVAPVMGSNP